MPVGLPEGTQEHLGPRMAVLPSEELALATEALRSLDGEVSVATDDKEQTGRKEHVTIVQDSQKALGETL